MKIRLDFFLIIQAMLIALKATGEIDWQWWIVLMPTWVPVVAILTVVVLVFFYFGLKMLLDLLRKS